MKADTSLPTPDEILRRVGRNLLLFQQIEGLLKFLLASHKGGGTPQDFKERRQDQVERINKQMLGNLVEKYGTEFLQDAGVEVAEEERPADWFSFSIRISCASEFLESMRRDLKLMTDERNELVHAFLPKWQPDSPEKIPETLAYLDAQREKALPILEHLRTNVDHMEQSRKLLAEFMASDEYRQQTELMLLQASPLVAFLGEVTSQIHRKDGWTYLAHAGELAAEGLPDEIKALKERYGFKTLKKLLLGCEIFDVLDEPLARGGFRTMYRNKPKN